MTSMNISVPDPMREWVQSLIERGAYASASEYMLELIRRDREDSLGREDLIAALEAGEASGISERQVPEIIAALKAELAGPSV